MNQKQLSIKRILIIDDDPIANMLTTLVVNKHSDAVASACSSGQQALDLFRSCEDSGYYEKIPDIILLDINMPQMNGWEFLDKFMLLPGNCAKKCRVIMLSSSIDPRDMERCKMYRCVERFISKPLTAEKVQNLFPGNGNFGSGDLKLSIEINGHRV